MTIFAKSVFFFVLVAAFAQAETSEPQKKADTLSTRIGIYDFNFRVDIIDGKT